MPKWSRLLLALSLCACRNEHSPARAGHVQSTSNGAVASLNIYSAAGANELSPVAARALPLVYVPNSMSASVSVIDPHTYQVVRTFHTGQIPQHVVPSWDMTRLWVLNNKSSSVTPIDPNTGQEESPIRVDDPYNMYFHPRWHHG